MDHSIHTITLTATLRLRDLNGLDLSSHSVIAKAMYVAQLVHEGTGMDHQHGRRTSIERISHLLCELLTGTRNIGLMEKDVLVLLLSQLLLADSLGMMPVHLNRVLKNCGLGELWL